MMKIRYLLLLFVMEFGCSSQPNEGTAVTNDFLKENQEAAIPDIFDIVIDSLGTRGFQVLVEPSSEDTLFFRTYTMDFEESARIYFRCGSGSRKLFARSLTPLIEDYFPRFGIREIRFDSPETARLAKEQIEEFIYHDDLWNEKIYDRVLNYEKTVIYIYTDAKMFDDTVEQWSEMISEIIGVLKKKKRNFVT
jgi:hypothetical protein